MSQGFQTKTVDINGTQHKILLENEQGPTALVALTNVLLLSPGLQQTAYELIQLVNNASNNFVSWNELLQVLSRVGLQNHNYVSNLNNEQLVQYLPQLQSGLNVNPGFNGSFEDGIEMSLFRLFNVGIVHGWIIDGDNDPVAYDHVARYTYESAQRLLVQSYDIKKNNLQVDNKDLILEDANYIKSFLARSATQLTEYGLKHLKEILVERGFAVLFRNEVYVTLYKNNGQLYTLVTDLQHRNDTDIIWQSLKSVNGTQDSYYTGNFISTSLERTNGYGPPQAAALQNPQIESVVSNPFSDQNQTSRQRTQPVETFHEDTRGQQLETDEELARRLQDEEDSRAADNMQGSYNVAAARARRQTNENATQQKKKKKGGLFSMKPGKKRLQKRKEKGKSEDPKDCIIM
ncbi:hypothetical protein NCAS_0D03700 [Naumovozyma castellii]|uniref:MINDY deubiquitinase domain-containing protein n=1 Tax=Naumovozyma castellii TaxID=27288 RepID=G0VEG0_NAUCA|nr:hypothetical protein NCAS_0D03700 [Naumovozyma castellii CBS 4309]CCC69951.1 hypothetical protein NCAS_0D03700 [Naumovozyma castellii CBS 4309]